MDPTTAAAAVSAVAAANNATKGGVIKSLIGPLAEAYGDDWGERARQRLASAKAERRQRNLSDHLHRAEAEVGAGEINPAELEAWLQGVADVDPRDKELSAAWHSVLRAMATGNPRREGLLRALQEMSPEEVLEFVQIASFPGASIERRRRFVDIGLLRPFSDNILLTLVGSFAMSWVWLLSCFLAIHYGIEQSSEAPLVAKSSTKALLWAIVIFGTIASVGASVYALLSLPRFTKLGNELRRQYRAVIAAGRQENSLGHDEGPTTGPQQSTSRRKRRKAVSEDREVPN